jgi:hypothetical protein
VGDRLRERSCDMGWLREADASSMWGYTAKHMSSHLMDDITPAFARPDAIVNNVS